MRGVVRSLFPLGMAKGYSKAPADRPRTPAMQALRQSAGRPQEINRVEGRKGDGKGSRKRSPGVSLADVDQVQTGSARAGTARVTRAIGRAISSPTARCRAEIPRLVATVDPQAGFAVTALAAVPPATRAPARPQGREAATTDGRNQQPRQGEHAEEPLRHHHAQYHTPSASLHHAPEASR
jgi:hypothetical protein